MPHSLLIVLILSLALQPLGGFAHGGADCSADPAVAAEHAHHGTTTAANPANTIADCCESCNTMCGTACSSMAALPTVSGPASLLLRLERDGVVLPLTSGIGPPPQTPPPTIAT